MKKKKIDEGTFKNLVRDEIYSKLKDTCVEKIDWTPSRKYFEQKWSEIWIEINKK